VARFCKVDLKTIHNWVDRQQIEHFRTPGRHLRFRRADVVDFLKRFNYPIPQDLVPRKVVVFCLTADPAFTTAARKGCGSEIDLVSYESVLDLGLAFGQSPPDVLLLDVDSMADSLDLVRSLKKHPTAEPCQTILCTQREFSDDLAAADGIDACIPRSSLRDLRATIEKLLGP